MTEITAAAPRKARNQSKMAAESATGQEPAATNPATQTRIGIVTGLLRGEGGASLQELVEATGWQTHTTRAALTGLRKKGHTIGKDKADGVARYSIATPPSQA